MIAARLKKGKPCKWKNGQEVMDWWLNWNNKNRPVDGQCSMF